ncbi:hypothetical protein WICMUC_001402 [Wickerhamomyces mucosus]|uniref:Uncharacterized protein n=1 Tax=Wickerhamomyces mucosus TaxID=1378264 RepID=A0A9P8PVI3_9ASCO|nr:hypothetical protein WICMUC_001402 [Wickerhamomyces mucosus]
MLILRSSKPLLKKDVPIFVQSLRYQSSSKPNSVVSQSMKDVAAKVSKKSINKITSNEYNALSNQNLLSSQNHSGKNTQVSSAQKLPKIKKDYSSVPKVPSLDYVDRVKFSIDHFYSGYRPLYMDKLKENLIPTRGSSLFSAYESCWSYSPSGSETFPEWESVDPAIIDTLKPFNPPLTRDQKIEIETKKEIEREKSMTLDANKRGRTIKQKGRIKPIAALLHNKRVK